MAGPALSILSRRPFDNLNPDVMKKVLLLPLLLMITVAAAAQIIRPFTPRYYNASVRGNIVYLSNSIISTTGIGTGVPGTGEVPPTGTSKDNAAAGINIDVDNPAPTPKISYGSTWNYYGNLTAPANDGSGNTWKQPAYTLNALWNTGASGSGNGKYGFNASQATCMPSGALPICLPVGNKYLSYYFRKTVNFTAAELTTFYALQLNVKRDDGIVIYVNGVERARSNMPAGTPIYTTLASSDITPGAAENFSVNLSPSFFSAGVNTIAVEVHLRSLTSADMSFDMEMLGLDDNGTYNATTADLSLPSCSEVLFAGLYWGADQGSNGTDSTWITAGYNTVKLKIPGASAYQTLTSTQTDRHSAAYSAGLPHVGYLCFKDITSLINTTNPNGTYSVANVLGPIGINNSCGGWTIVIAYANPSLQQRNLTVFDGSVIINQGDPAVDVSISGFLTPPSGAVSCELGSVVYDGDRGSTDSFAFKQAGAASFYNLATTTVPLNGTADAWNSKISYKGAVVTTRNPAYNNTLGYDASIFELPNTSNAQLGNNKTSATVRFSSPGENYFVQVLTTSITQYTPTFAFDKTATDINGGTLVPGDSLRYQVNFNNVGNDSSTNTVIIDNIPAGSTFLPGSIKIGGVAKSDGSGDDQAEYDAVNRRVVFRVGTGANAVTGGRIGPGVSGNVQFDVVIASSCDILACSNSLRNSARINYTGKTSGLVLYDSSGVNTSGCIIKGPVISTATGSCFSPKDTVIVNRCPAGSITLPWRRYAGYVFYTATPFIPANQYDPYLPVTSSGIFWAYFDNGAGCSDTARIAVVITGCPDIDDDNDGIPDYVEFDNPLALQDHNSNGIPNWNDPSYPGWVDNNSDAVNDRFDYGADMDNDGIPNFYDTDFPGFIDTNGDGVNDNADKDKDGIPNQYDLDSDNDGIPDTVESYGVDTNGDGIIDNYTDTDNDGFSQNVDANNTGVNGSSVGLGPQDFDGDGIPNYLDTDSDNDGIPDVVEVSGPYTANTGHLANFLDLNSDGLSDNNINGTALLITGPDADNNGRADNWPNKNLDRDLRPNPYDVDSDGDGIVDVIEAGLPDANLNGIVDGTIGSNGWSASVSALPALGIRSTDGDGKPDYLDIDSDDDGIPDNIEGQPTATYKLPALTDTDGDGLVNTYDNFAGFSGSGIFLYDHDGDGIPDVRDLDTDADGQPDIIEGNDFNLNHLADDNVTLTGLDTDGDGLDNRFDSLNSVINVKGTSYMMGNNGSLTGDATPGTRATVQKRIPAQLDRDWRYVGTVLPVDFLQFTAIDKGNTVDLHWVVKSAVAIDHFEVERSTGNSSFSNIGRINGTSQVNTSLGFAFTDNMPAPGSDVLYYRIRVVAVTQEVKLSEILLVRKPGSTQSLTVMPNPASDYVTLNINAGKASVATIRLVDNAGRVVLQEQRIIRPGNNIITWNSINKYGSGVYSLQVMMNEALLAERFFIRP